MMKRHSMRAFVSALALVTAFSAQAEEAAGYSDFTLTGSWGGYRDDLAESGVTTDVIYKYDVMGNISGGLREGMRTLDNLDVIIGFDNEKLLGIKGNSAVIQFLNNSGPLFDGAYLGTIGVINNIETAPPTGKLYQAWVQQNFMEDRFSFLAGVYDLNSEFYITESSLPFLHSTFGIGTEIGISGQNGPSIFPTTGLAARFSYQPTEQTYLRLAILDGVPGDVQNAKGSHIFRKIGGSDGALLVAEGGFMPQEGNKFAAGIWQYTEEFDHLTAVDALGNPVRETGSGFYFLGEHPLYQEVGAEGQGLTGFLRLGFANDEVHQVDYSWSVGLTYTGLIPSRDEGLLALGFYDQHIGKEYRAANVSDDHEGGLELTYVDNITPWLAVQPDVQYVVNPGAVPTTEDAWVLGTRFTILF